MAVRHLLLAFAFVIGGLAMAAAQSPNVVLIFIDDMGYGDLSCYGNTDIETPHIDKLAAEGTKFTQFYVASPICSPSRVGITTGQFPARHRIHSYLASRQRNRDRGMADFLNPDVPAIARTFKNAGYATAHFGKWHMGGGRDVDDAPHPKAYGFDESLVSFEGLGDRLLIEGDGLSRQSSQLRQGNIQWVPKHRLTPMYVDRSVDFIERNHDKPFYLHLWLNDVHDPFRPTEEQLEKFKRFADNKPTQQYYAVIDAMDQEIGRLVKKIDDLGLKEKTLIVLCSDNGPTAWPHYEKRGFEAPGSTAGLRGRKWSLYEGGIREPLIVRWPAKVPQGKTNKDSVVSSLDFLPTFCALAGIEPPEVEFDGVDQSELFLGKDTKRTKPLLWEYGRDASYLRPAKEKDRSPNMAIRDGHWKLLMNADGSDVELYDFEKSDKELDNVAADHPDITAKLKQQLIVFRDAIPDYPSTSSKDAAKDIFGKENLVAWCIVPFDASKRGPTERAQMLQRLGIRKVAYDWRKEHVPTFEEEILAYKKHDLEYFAFWSWHPDMEPLIAKHDIRPQIWVTCPSPQGDTQQARIEACAAELLPHVKRTEKLGCKLGLYNHGGWGGEPANLVAVCQHLREKHNAEHVGIVYNFHHGHGHIEDFADVLRQMQPYLLCLNINGMNDNAQPKILPLGQGKHEKAMLQTILTSGYDGPIGILDHRSDVDAEKSLRENLEGLEELKTDLR